MVTYDGLFQYTLVILTAISLFYNIYKNKKQFLNKRNTALPPTGLPVTEILPYVFFESQITSIKLPDSLETIGEYAFMFCENLKNIEIPESVKYICENAFNSCTAAESITILNPECEIYDSYLTMYQFTGTIYGYENSTAQEYAEKYEYNFSALSKVKYNRTYNGAE